MDEKYFRLHQRMTQPNPGQVYDEEEMDNSSSFGDTRIQIDGDNAVDNTCQFQVYPKLGSRFKKRLDFGDYWPGARGATAAAAEGTCV